MSSTAVHRGSETPAFRLEEPVGILADLRKLAEHDPERARSEGPKRLADYVWRVRYPLFERAGIGLSDVQAMIGGAGADREIWLWVRGDRRWGQIAPQLEGRVERRLGLSA